MRTCRDRRFRKKQPVTRKLGERSHRQSTAPNQMLRSLPRGWGFSLFGQFAFKELALISSRNLPVET